MADAARLDAEDAAGHRRGPLHGVPIGVKGLFDVAGGDQSYGSDVRDGAVAAADAAIVRRLRDAGAVVVGTTRTHEFGWGITTQHATRGSTRNPHDLTRVPGGSSGGSAAAVAAGFVPLAVGSDTGGSIRIPAAFCGVVGLKTTHGRISRAGGVALAPSFDTPGLLSRSAALLAAALAATAGADPDDPATAATPPLDDLVGPSDLTTRTFALVDNLTTQALSAPRLGALADTIAALGSLGLRQLDVAVPDGQDWYAAFAPIQMTEALQVHRSVLATYPARADDYGPDVRRRLELAEQVTDSEHRTARAAADAMTASILRTLEGVDVIVSPVGSVGPSSVDDPDHVQFGGARIALRDAVMPSTVAQNVAGLPSVTVPVGRDDDGLPIGIQLTGRRWSEPLLLSVAMALEIIGLVSVPEPGKV